MYLPTLRLFGPTQVSARVFFGFSMLGTFEAGLQIYEAISSIPEATWSVSCSCK